MNTKRCKHSDYFPINTIVDNYLLNLFLLCTLGARRIYICGMAKEKTITRGYRFKIKNVRALMKLACAASMDLNTYIETVLEGHIKKTKK